MTTGRKMDEAWKRAISKGKKRLGVSDSTLGGMAGRAATTAGLVGGALAARKLTGVSVKIPLGGSRMTKR